jgi:hypothetical protein
MSGGATSRPPAGLGALAPLAGQLHSMGQDIGAHVPRASARPERHG